MDKLAIKEREQVLIKLVTNFCTEHLDEEYAQLSMRLVEKMGRKKYVPFMAGKLEIWAAGVVHALATINFGFDTSGTLFTTVPQINEFFGTNMSTSTQRSKELRDMFRLTYWDKEFARIDMKKSEDFKEAVMCGFITPTKRRS